MIERAVASDTISLPRRRVEIGSQRLRLAGDRVRRVQRPAREHHGMTYRSCGRFNRFKRPGGKRVSASHAESRVHTLVTEGRTDAANDMISIPIRAPAQESSRARGFGGTLLN